MTVSVSDEQLYSTGGNQQITSFRNTLVTTNHGFGQSNSIYLKRVSYIPRKKGIKAIYCASYHPVSNGQIERYVQMKQALKKAPKEEWNIGARFLFAQHITSSMTRILPAKALMSLRTILNGLHPDNTKKTDARKFKNFYFWTRRSSICQRISDKWLDKWVVVWIVKPRDELHMKLHMKFVRLTAERGSGTSINWDLVTQGENRGRPDYGNWDEFPDIT